MAIREAAVGASVLAASPALDPYRLRADFPILATTVHGRPLIYLDSASTSQNPKVVLVRLFFEALRADDISDQYWSSFRSSHQLVEHLVEA